MKLFYNNGKDSYTIEKQLAPGEQIWTNVGEIIRNQIPDKDGKTIPPDVMMGSYELRDLDHRGVGYLYEGKLVIDKTWGHRYYGCGGCCGYKAAALNPNPSSGMINTYGYDQVDGEDCTNTWYDFTGDSYSWGSSNTSIATLANPQTHFVGVGSTSGYAHVQLESNHVPCNVYTFQPQSPQNTQPSVDLSCNKAHLALGNGSPAPTNTGTGTCSTTVSPAGGNFRWSASGSTISLTPNGGSATYAAANPSSKVGDTSITVTYTVNGQKASATNQGITVHKPTALVVLSDNFNPAGNVCSVNCLKSPGDGTCNANTSVCGYTSYLRQREYGILDQFNPANEFWNLGIGYATVVEQLPYTTTCPDINIKVGTASSSRFVDSFYLCSRCCQSKGPGCSAGSNPQQTISANGYPVRTETITWTCIDVTLTP